MYKFGLIHTSPSLIYLSTPLGRSPGGVTIVVFLLSSISRFFKSFARNLHYVLLSDILDLRCQIPVLIPATCST